MSELEEKLGAVLSNPQLMQQIMSMAQAMGSGQTPKEDTPKEDTPKEAPVTQPMPNLDPRLLQSISGMAQNSSVDKNQQSLLKALSPYLSHNRISKLERAMRAARMAGVASSFLNSGGLQMLTGR